MQTVVETPTFLATAAKAGMSADERRTAVMMLAANPSAGDLIQGGGGIRKVRVPRRGQGKSGGYRILTYYLDAEEPVFLLAVLSKSRQANFTAAQVTELRRVAKSIRDERWGNMNQEDFANLVSGLEDVGAFKRGARDGYTVQAPGSVDVKAIRRKTRQTQEGFARTYGFSVSAVRDWEQGRRQPERAARLLLALIADEPETIERALRRI